MATMIDEYHGQGGSYLLDPESGKRTLVQRTEPSTPDPTPEVTSDAAPESQTDDFSEG